MPERRFPPPWPVEELDAFFVACDHNGQKLTDVYFEDGVGLALGHQAAHAR
jgi:hypothetical protein